MTHVIIELQEIQHPTKPLVDGEYRDCRIVMKCIDV